MDSIRILIVMSATLLSRIQGYPIFQTRIPNGARVPNPCDKTQIWNGVGHQNKNGGGPLNPFGMDFRANNFVWNSTICQTDSDGDGFRNGQELGDPNCVWTNGTTPTGNAMRHPGICEPLDSAICVERNAWLMNCTVGIFNCPPIDNQDVLNYTMRLPVTDIPVADTTYGCFKFSLPGDRMYDIIAIRPVIDNIQAVHHMLIYGCTSNPTGHADNETYFCDMITDLACVSLIGGWTVGVAGQCFNDQMGLRIGPNGFTYAIMQIHWNNAQRISGLTDSSGLEIYYTPQLRPNRGGNLIVGQTYLEIPPGRQLVTATSSCSSICTRQFPTPLSITFTILHMHSIGISGEIAIYRNNSLVQVLEDVQHYDFNDPQMSEFPEPIKLLPGDEIRLRCDFRSLQRNTTTIWGDSTTQNEMCNGVIIYYPMIDNFTICYDWKTIEFCGSLTNYLFESCDFPTFLKLLGALAMSSCSDNCTTDSCSAILDSAYGTGCTSYPDVMAFVSAFMPPQFDIAFTKCASTQSLTTTQSSAHSFSYSTGILLTIFSYFSHL